MNNLNIFNITPWNLLEQFLSQDLSRTDRIPPVNIYSNENSVIFDVRIPGVKPENVDVNIEDRSIVITGKDDMDEKKEAFKRRFNFPFKVDQDKASASFKNGVLRIQVIKAEMPAPKKVAITVG